MREGFYREWIDSLEMEMRQAAIERLLLESGNAVTAPEES